MLRAGMVNKKELLEMFLKENKDDIAALQKAGGVDPRLSSPHDTPLFRFFNTQKHATRDKFCSLFRSKNHYDPGRKFFTESVLKIRAELRKLQEKQRKVAPSP